MRAGARSGAARAEAAPVTVRALRFNAVMRIRDGNPYIPISAARAAQIKAGWRKPLPVLVRINGQPRAAWHINMMPTGAGGFYLFLHGAVRKASATRVGDRVSVEVRFDGAYRGGPMHPVPAWFRRALDRHPNAKAAWRALIPSRQKEILRYFSWLKSPDARARNVGRALQVLSGKPGRFMGRAWRNGV